jgi:hypothetical protein
MSKHIIHIRSVKNGTLVTILNGSRKLKSRRFGDIEQAMEFVLPRGDRNSTVFLNGYMLTPYAWVK